MKKSFFSRSRSTQSKDSWGNGGTPSKEGVSKEAIEEFGRKKFDALCKQYGKKYALAQVTRSIRQMNLDEKSHVSSGERTEEADDSFDIEDTDVWCADNSIECVLGAI